MMQLRRDGVCAVCARGELGFDWIDGELVMLDF
jgi:hypothetical protein